MSSLSIIRVKPESPTIGIRAWFEKKSGSNGGRRQSSNLEIDGKEFEFWKMQIEDYLYQKKLHEPLSGKKPEKMEQADWDLLDRQALGVVRLTLARNVAFNIVKEKTTADLKMRYQICTRNHSPRTKYIRCVAYLI